MDLYVKCDVSFRFYTKNTSTQRKCSACVLSNVMLLRVPLGIFHESGKPGPQPTAVADPPDPHQLSSHARRETVATAAGVATATVAATNAAACHYDDDDNGILVLGRGLGALYGFQRLISLCPALLSAKPFSRQSKLAQLRPGGVHPACAEEGHRECCSL